MKSYFYPTWQKVLLNVESNDTILKICKRSKMSYSTTHKILRNILLPLNFIEIIQRDKTHLNVLLTDKGKEAKEKLFLFKQICDRLGN